MLSDLTLALVNGRFLRMIEDRTTFDIYQDFVYELASKNPPDMVAWSVAGLCSEAGEVSAVLEKAWRKTGHLTEKDISKLFDELGDVMWYMAAVANALDFSLDDVMMHNINKLNIRKNEGTLHDSSNAKDKVENDIA